MASNIDFESIDETFPISGRSQSSQGFRDNFNTIKLSLSAAKAEIENLQEYSDTLPTSDDVNSIILSYNYITITDVSTLLTEQEYTTVTDVNSIIVGYDYITITDVSTLLTEQAYITKSDLPSLLVEGDGIVISFESENNTLTFDIETELTSSILSLSQTALVDTISGKIVGPIAGPLESTDGKSSVLMNANDLSITSTEIIKINSETSVSIATETSAGDVYLGNGTNQIKFSSFIDTDDSSELTVIPAALFKSNVIVENELFANNIPGYLKIDTLKAVVSASSDFNDFKVRISSL